MVKHAFKAVLLEEVFQGMAKSNCVKDEGSLKMSGGWRWEEEIRCWMEAAVAGSAGLEEVGFGG